MATILWRGCLRWGQRGGQMGRAKWRYYRRADEDAPPKKGPTGENSECWHVILGPHVPQDITDLQPDVSDRIYAVMVVLECLDACAYVHERRRIVNRLHGHLCFRWRTGHGLCRNYVEWLVATQMVTVNNINVMVKPVTYGYSRAGHFESILAYVCKGECVMLPDVVDHA